MKKKYLQLATLNLILGICAICLYLPYTLEAFDMPGFEWFSFVSKVLKHNYYNVLVYFGVFLLLWIIVLTILSLLSRPNVAKFTFKICTIISLVIPLIYVLALKNDKALEFWIKTLAPNIKMISLVLMCVSWGSFVLALIFNYTRKNHANLHHIVQALVACVLLTLIVLVNGWCGWSFNDITKIEGVLIGLFAIYLPISSVILFVCRNKRD
ncbi:MAG: hypothetical protein IJ458_02545 [Clostridia bacterium]|nr:hypothetical protein [Clostridia bacterium]